MTGVILRRQRCAIYTRKSSEEGLEMEFNSLDAQREACEAYVASQRSEGWAAIRERYDDGGFSGGTLERPALRRLLPADLEPATARTKDAHVLRAIARAWSWRRQLESGAVSTICDIAAAEKVSDRFVSRMMRLAYLSPEVLEHLVIRHLPPALSLNDLVAAADRPWAEQMNRMFDAPRE